MGGGTTNSRWPYPLQRVDTAGYKPVVLKKPVINLSKFARGEAQAQRVPPANTDNIQQADAFRFGELCTQEFFPRVHMGGLTKSPPNASGSRYFQHKEQIGGGLDRRPASSHGVAATPTTTSIRTPEHHARSRPASQLSQYNSPMYKADLVQPWRGDCTDEVHRAAWGQASPHRLFRITEENLFLPGSGTRHFCSTLMAPMRHLNTWVAQPLQPVSLRRP